jgi:flagellar protein FlaI
MAIDEQGGDERSGVSVGATDPAMVGEYSWSDFRREEHDGGSFDRRAYLGFDPRETGERLRKAADAARALEAAAGPLDVPEGSVTKGLYTWEEFAQDHDTVLGEANPAEHLGFDPDEVTNRLATAESVATSLSNLIDERTVDVNEAVDEDAFFTNRDGTTTLVNRYDVEKAVPREKKGHFVEESRYWVNKPYACVFIFKSIKENEYKYYVIEPHMTEIEHDLQEFLGRKLKQAIKYSDDEVVVQGSDGDRAAVIQRETEQLLERYDLHDSDDSGGRGRLFGTVRRLLGRTDDGSAGHTAREDLSGLSARPEPVVLAEDSRELSEYQVEKLLYVLKRNFIGYGRIDAIKYDINVEDISCDGYNTRVFVYHGDHEQIISNVSHGEHELDNFVVKLAQRSGMGISKRQPQVDATLPDGSRAQLTLGTEVSDHGTNYTIRQFNDVPFTPVDLINWNTFSLDEMAFLWLCIENNKALIFAGGTASGKTTSLNAVSLFIPSNAKIVSIEDTREVELPQRNWVASVTRPSFGQEEAGQIDEFDLLEAALRQRPDYIVMGEVRGEEGRTLFQVMSTGHTTYTTFHADSVGEVIKRFTTDPINVSKTLFTALDLVSIQTQTRVDGHKVRRNKVLTEINEYTPENDEINVRDVYEWRAETDDFIQMGSSSTLEEIKFDRGWTQEKLDEELFKRKLVLAYLIREEINTYTEVAATIQAFINDPESILAIISQNRLERSLEDLREMESVKIDIDQQKEELVPRPDPPSEMLTETERVLERGEPVLDQYRQVDTTDLASALEGLDDSGVDETDEGGLDFGQFVPKVDEGAE